MSLRISGGRRLQSPEGLATRPTPARVRLAVMNMMAARLAGSRWLDLCSGSGVMACEALQHGVRAAVAVEADRRTAGLCRRNLEAVASGLPGPPSVSVVTAEALGWLERGRPERWEPFDLIYADPPYRAGLQDPIARAVLAGRWMAADGVLLLECSRQATPTCPPGWQQRGEPRRYGQTCLLLLELIPRGCCPADTDSRLPRTNPPG